MRPKWHNCLIVLVFGAALIMAAQSKAQQATPVLTQDQVARIIASPDRSAADRTNDLRRKPDLMLAFIGIRPGIVALDVSAAGGYTTELLARAVGPNGRVYGQSQPSGASPPPRPA